MAVTSPSSSSPQDPHASSEDREIVRLERENGYRVHRLEDNVRTLASTVTGLETNVSYIRSAIDQLAQRQNRGVNWGWVLTGLLGTATVFGGYSTLMQRPLELKVQAHSTQIEKLSDRLIEDSYRTGYQRARQDVLLESLGPQNRQRRTLPPVDPSQDQ